MRIVVVEEEILHISDNVMEGLGENNEQCWDLIVNTKIVEEMFNYTVTTKTPSKHIQCSRLTWFGQMPVNGK